MAESAISMSGLLGGKKKKDRLQRLRSSWGPLGYHARSITKKGREKGVVL